VPYLSNPCVIRVGSSNSPRGAAGQSRPWCGAVCLAEIVGVRFNTRSSIPFGNSCGLSLIGHLLAPVWSAGISYGRQLVQICTGTEGNSLICEPALNFLGNCWLLLIMPTSLSTLVPDGCIVPCFAVCKLATDTDTRTFCKDCSALVLYRALGVFLTCMRLNYSLSISCCDEV